MTEGFFCFIFEFVFYLNLDIHLAGDGGTQPIHLAARHTKAARRARYSVNGTYSGIVLVVSNS